MKKYHQSIVSIPFFLVTVLSCESQIAVDDLSRAPVFAAEDKLFADVFKPLDGVWHGTFTVYTDVRGQIDENVRPEQFAAGLFDSLPLGDELEIAVRQEYVSESPYFQRVKIRDEYRDGNGTLRIVESHGVNKVQDGKMWCVVKKPDETVIHSGSLEGIDTIIWQRNLHSPLKIEYFRETVITNEYTIIGWGYYGDDDPDLSPRRWFKGICRRVEK